MTRDEAVKIIEKLRDTRATDEVGALIDCFLDLGMLKLGKSEVRDFAPAMTLAFRSIGTSVSQTDIKAALEVAGLKIVEA